MSRFFVQPAELDAIEQEQHLAQLDDLYSAEIGTAYNDHTFVIL